MQFLSDDWLAALDEAARSRPVPDDDPLAGVSITVDQVVTGVRTWRLVVDDGALSVVADPVDEPDVRLTADADVAGAVARGERSALDAFIAGDLVLGGDVARLLAARPALEAIGDLFADVKASTTHDA